MTMNPKVFLGGTCNQSTWRDELIQDPVNKDVKLEMDFFNPVVEDWKPEDAAIEVEQRENCDYCLYNLTPKMTGAFSIAEVVDDSHKRPEKTLFSMDVEDDGDKFTDEELVAFDELKEMITTNGGTVIDGGVEGVRDYLNNVVKNPPEKQDVENSTKCSNELSNRVNKMQVTHKMSLNDMDIMDVANMINDSHNPNKKTTLCTMTNDSDRDIPDNDHSHKALRNITKMAAENGVHVLDDPNEIDAHLDGISKSNFNQYAKRGGSPQVEAKVSSIDELIDELEL